MTTRNGRQVRSSVTTAMLWALVAVLAGITFGLWLGPEHGLSAVRAPLRIAWPILAAGFLLGHFATFRVEFHDEGHGVDLTDVVLLPAIVFGGVGGAVLAALVGTTARAAYMRRAPIKTAFNIALHGAVVSIAVVVYHATLGGATVLSFRGWMAALVTGVAAQAISVLGVRAAISVSARRVTLPDPNQLMLSLGVAAGIDVVLGLAGVFLLWSSVSGALLFFIVACGVGIGHSRYGRLRVRHKNVTSLYDFDKSLAASTEPGTVIDAVLAGAIALFNVEIATLVMIEGSDVACRILHAGREQSYLGPAPMPLVELIRSGPSTVLAPSRPTDPVMGSTLRASGYRDAIAVRLPAETDTRLEVLVIANHLGGREATFDNEDVEMAEGVAASAAMALRNCGLLVQLRSEIAVKEYQAMHDPLTGLANRELFATELARALDTRLDGALVGLMLIDIDGFKVLNDTHGHEAGDVFLQAVAGAVSAAIGNNGVVGRLGGDEFVVVVPSMVSVDELEQVANDVDLAVRRCGESAGTSGRLRASIGVTAAPVWSEDRFTLMRQADLAMYRAKQRGGGVAMHDDADNGEIDDPSLVAWLREAIGTPSLELFYQPKVRLDGGHLAGVEALLRWTHPLQGPIPPDRFIPVAEHSGLIRPLTSWVLGEAVRQMAAWRAAGRAIDVAVNISPTQMSDPAIVSRVRSLLTEYDVPAHALTLEITESANAGGAVVSDPSVLGLLSCLGVRLSIDDFGVGTSSLARVRSLPVSELKIDRSFVASATTHGEDAAIVASTIELAHQLGLDVVAEGVEDGASYRLLDELGCDIAQGYLIGEPVSGEELIVWLDRPAIGPSEAVPALRVLHGTLS